MRAALLVSFVFALLSGCGRVGLELIVRDVPDGSLDDASAPEEASAPEGATCADDGDQDGVCDERDNCPALVNADQEDRDGDGNGDRCDADRDDDGIPDDTDVCPDDSRNDTDGDGVCDDDERCPGGDDRNDQDRDGTPDSCDSCPAAASGDTDGDGACDDRDICPSGDDRLDGDSDGTPDACDACPAEPAKVESGLCACTREPRPIAYYPFDESSGSIASDVRGAHPGTLVDFSGMPWGPGAVRNALSFDGIDDYVQVGAVSPRVRSLVFRLEVNTFSVTNGETGWRNPTATGSRDNDWANPTNAFRLDRVYAGTGDFSNFSRQDWYGFHLVVPSAAMVPGIAVDVVFNNSNVTAVFRVDLSWNGGLTYTPAKDIPLRTYMDERLAFGGPMDSWGHAWTPGQLSDANFRVRLTKDGIPLSPIIAGVDEIRVKAYYSSATAIGRRVLGVAPGAYVELAGQQLATSGWPAGTVIYVDGSATSLTAASGFRHVVISSPSDVDVSRLQIGGVANEPPFFHGVIDDLRLYEETLTAAQVAALFAAPACGQ